MKRSSDGSTPRINMTIRSRFTCAYLLWYNIEPVHLPQSACAAHGLLRVSREARVVFWASHLILSSASSDSRTARLISISSIQIQMKLVSFTTRPSSGFSERRASLNSLSPSEGVEVICIQTAYKTGGRYHVSLSPQLLHTQRLCAVSTVLAMNAFPNGTRVFYWASGGEIKYGTVQATNRMADGTQIVVVKVDGEGHAQLPVSSLVKVNQ